MYTLMYSVQPFWGKRDQGNFYRFMPVTPEFPVVCLEITELPRLEKTTKITNDLCVWNPGKVSEQSHSFMFLSHSVN